MKKIYKALPKNLAEEGLTLDLINGITMDYNYSPVMLEPNDEPCKLMKCGTGYWIVLEDGSFLKEGKFLYVVDDIKAQIGRARYLMLHGYQEKQEKIKALCEYWRKLVKEKISDIESKILMEDKFRRDDGLYSVFRSLPGYNEAKSKEKTAMLEDLHTKAKEMLAKDDIIGLLEGFSIKKFNNPMLSVKLDDTKGIGVLKNVFGADEIHQWDGEILNRYAAIEIEKEYPYFKNLSDTNYN